MGSCLSLQWFRKLRCLNVVSISTNSLFIHFLSVFFYIIDRKTSKEDIMSRTALADRAFPEYTRGEEIMNMVTHIVGAAMAVAILVLCIVKSAKYHDAWAVVSSSIYGTSMILVFTISSIYHGLNKNMGKQVMRIIDHCDIYLLIAGTYTPIIFVALRPENLLMAWILFGIEWGCAILAIVFNAIDLHNYRVFSMICYLAMGWGIVFCFPATIRAMTFPGAMWLLAGGISFTVGAILYGLGAKIRYMHSVFHLFVVLGCFLQFIAVYFYAL